MKMIIIIAMLCVLTCNL